MGGMILAIARLDMQTKFRVLSDGIREPARLGLYSEYEIITAGDT